MNPTKESKLLNLSDFEYAYMQYFNELYRFAYHYIMSDDAEDVVQEIFLKIYNDYTLLSNVTNIRAYLYKMTKNSCIDYLKHVSIQNKHQESLINSILSSVEDYDIEQESETKGKIANCLSSLPEKQKAIMMLRLEGKDYNEIAKILQISVGTVNTHVNRAYKFMKNNYFILLYFTIVR